MVKQQDSVKKLIELANNIAKGVYSNEIMELTTSSYPPDIRELAEAFSMMMVKVEAREFKLEMTIQELQEAKKQLEEYARMLEKKVKSIEIIIDEEKRKKQVKSIIDTDYFQKLQQDVIKMKEEYHKT